MQERSPARRARCGSKLSLLSRWPRHPGGATAGALIGIASVLLFFLGIPALRAVLPAAPALAVALWALISRRSAD